MGDKATRYNPDNVFTYHKPHGDQPQRYEDLHAAARHLAQDIIAMTPASREQSIALTKLEEAIFWANAAIARNEQPPGEPSQAAA